MEHHVDYLTIKEKIKWNRQKVNVEDVEHLPVTFVGRDVRIFMRKADMISNGYHEHRIDFDKIAVEHTQAMIKKGLMLDDWTVLLSM